jgi:hypothetical protein
MERGFIYLLYIQLSKVILYHRLTKVDGQMSRGSRDKCPDYPWFESIIFLE